MGTDVGDEMREATPSLYLRCEFELTPEGALLRKGHPAGVRAVDRVRGILKREAPTDVLIDDMRGPVPARVPELDTPSLDPPGLRFLRDWEGIGSFLYMSCDSCIPSAM